jgi:hypothetical protein
MENYNSIFKFETPIPSWVKILLLVILLSLIVSTCTRYVLSHVKEVELPGVVQSHHITNDSQGQPMYYTIILLDNGNIVTKQGLNYYVIPEGKKVVVTDFIFE